VTALETFRCPACLFVLADAGQKRCPSCHERLRQRGGPIVIGGRSKLDDQVDRVATEIRRTTIFQPSQLDPGMRQVLDDFDRRARAAIDDDGPKQH
jgi:hypothetical protein